MKPRKKQSPGKNRKTGPKSSSASSVRPPVIPFARPPMKAGMIATFILVTVTFLLYFRTVDYGYILDDGLVITENIYTKRGIQGIPDLLKRESFEGYFKEKKILVEGGRYRPLSLITFAVEWSAFAKEMKDSSGKPVTDNKGMVQYEGNPHVSHFINILLYALTGILIFYVLYGMFRPEPGRLWLWNIPFAGALLFILHPVHIEAVANIKGRDEIMAMLFAMSALWFSLRYVYEGIPSKKALYLFLSGIFFLLGLLSKENAVTFLAVIPLTIYFFTPARLSSNLRAVLPALIATLLYAWIRIGAVGLTGAGKEITDLINNPFYGMSFGDKFATIFYTLLLYFKLLFFPHPLTTDYWPYHIPWMHWSDPWSIVSLALYVLLAIIAVTGFKKKSLISYCILFFITTLSVTSNIVFPIGSFMNERFIFMSSLAFCIFVSWLAIERIPKISDGFKESLNIAGAILIIAISAGFIYKTYQRIPDWKDGFSLNASAVQVSRNSARANCYMGNALFKYRYLPAVETLKNLQKDTVSGVGHADSVKVIAILDSIYGYLNNAVRIMPKYGVALDLKSGIAAELYKFGELDEEHLLNVYDTLILSGENVPFVLSFTQYLNRKVMAAEQNSTGKNREKAVQNISRLKQFHLSAYNYYTSVRPNQALSLSYLRLAAQVAPGDTVIASLLDKAKKQGQSFDPQLPGR